MNGRQPTPVLWDAYHRKQVDVIDVYVANISDKKCTSTIVKELQRLHPLNSLQHLKRVRAPSSKDGPLQIVVCQVSDIAYRQVNADDSQKIDIDLDLSSIKGLGHPYKVKVPSSPPLTRLQYEEAIKFWPVNFHEDKRISKLLSGNYFTTAEVESFEGYMAEAVQMARLGAGKGQRPIGVVIVDPVENVIVAKAFDLRDGCHPLQHSVMVGVDLVAHSQGGGMWNLSDADLYHQPPPERSSPPPSQSKTGPYLCTGYDLFVTLEPCIMCSMALVHSRISRVFYGSSIQTGALGSHYKINCQPGLNHYYSVFKGLLCHETDQLYHGER